MAGREMNDKDPRSERGSFGLIGRGASGGSESGGAGRLPFQEASSGVNSDSHLEDPWPVRFRTFLDRCSRLLVDIIGEENVEGVFLCGSFAYNEGSVVFEEGIPFFLSDIDLVVVLESLEAHRRFYPERNELGERCEGLLPGAGFMGRVEVAILLPGDLERFPPRPGVFDMKKLGRMLYGDREAIDRIPEYREDLIGGREAVVLLENRIIPFLGSYPRIAAGTKEAPYRFLYQITRAYTDMATSALCLAGLYRPGYVVRSEFLVENRENDLLSWLIPGEVLEKVEMWTHFKIEPLIGMLDFELDDRGSLNLWEETASDLLDFWKKAESHCQNPHADRSRLPTVRALLSSRSRCGGRFENLTAWKTYLAPLSFWRKSGLVAALKGRILSSNPLEIVRESGVRLLDHHMRHGVGRDVPESPGGFPYKGANWICAVFSLHSLWVWLVFGRKDS